MARVIGGMWRWAWTAGVFGIFFVVVGAALDSAPPADGALPVIGPGPAPIKERVALPDIQDVVPRSSVLNLLAEEADAGGQEAVAALEAALDAEAARAATVARVEAAVTEIRPGEEAGAPAEAAVESAADAAIDDDADGDAGPADRAVAAEDANTPGPFASVPTPGRRPSELPERPARTDKPAAMDASAPPPRRTAAASGGDFRIQLAAVPPGEEQATFDRLEQRFADVLDGLAPRFQAISTDAGVLVRVQAAGLASEDAAMERCRRIRAAGGDCFVVGVSG